MKSLVLFLSSIVAVLLPYFAEQQQNPSDLFFAGKKLVEKNCGECMGSTQAGLETGIANIEKAINLGYTDKKQAYLILADAYNTLALAFLAPGGGRTYVPEEEEAAAAKRDDIIRHLYELYPEDVDVLIPYSHLVDDHNVRLELYMKILQKDPAQFEIRYNYSAILLKKGDWQKGLDQRVVAVQDADRIYFLKRAAESLVTIVNHPEEFQLPLRCEADRMKIGNLSRAIEKIEWFSYFAEFVRTTRTAMEEFKVMFKNEVSRIECTPVVR